MHPVGRCAEEEGEGEVARIILRRPGVLGSFPNRKLEFQMNKTKSFLPELEYRWKADLGNTTEAHISNGIMWFNGIETIMLAEISQFQKDNHFMFFLICSN